MDYKNKNVIVTGDTGFKGTWLSLMLSKLGANVLGISEGVPRDNDIFFNKANLQSVIKHIDLDVTWYDEMRNIMSEFKPDYIFHLAAQPLVLKSYDEPRRTIITNTFGTLNVVDCCRFLNDVTCVIITTDKVYKETDSIWGHRETDELGTADPYSTSKAMAEMIVESYNKSYNLSKQNVQLVTARGGNVIGGGDWSRDRIVPDFIKAKIGISELKIRNAAYIRPWQHVLDLLYGYLLLGYYAKNTKELKHNAFNFGPDPSSTKSVRELIECLTCCFEEPFTYEIQTNKDQKEARALTLDSTLAKKYLGWKPFYDFETMVWNTAEWYKAVIFENKNALMYSMSQIDKYLGLVGYK